jgi:NAD(P)-dependent dehydrogenase (short-subunit alcohol dehydrogenase family)
MDVEGRVAIVTGAAAGAGRAIALRLGVEGSEVVVADIDPVGGEETVAAIAAGGGHAHFPDASPAQWGATLDLNLRGAMLATQLCLEPMRRGGGGAVVNVASTAGLGLGPYQSPEYGAAKAGLIRFTSSLAHLRERMGVRVNCIVPDWIGTERAQEELARMTAEERAATPPPLPLGDVAGAVLELVRDDELSGRVMVLWRDAPPRLLAPE